MPPPLSASIIHEIFAHLLPPTPPLPIALLSRSLLDRLTFIPPSPTDIDAHLSPFPTSSSSSSSHPISSRLESLTQGYEAAGPVYTYDGEVILARITLQPIPKPYPDLSPSPDTERFVEVIFEFEDGPKARGWVYHSARLPPPGEHLEWVEDIGGVKRPEVPDGSDIQDYWAGFTPPPSKVGLPDGEGGGVGGGQGGEDDYWAQYGGGEIAQTPAGETPGIPIGSRKEEDTLVGLELDSELKAKPSDSGTAYVVDSVFRDKLISKINVQLRKMWWEFRRTTTTDEGERSDMLEDKALVWLRLGRDCGSATPMMSQNPAEEIAVLRGKMEVLVEMYDLVRDDEREGEGEAGFFRLLEEVIRVPRRADTVQDELDFD